MLSCACCNGVCGPNNGCNCLACQALDREAQDQRDEDAARPTPSAQLIESWTWGPQPGTVFRVHEKTKNPWCNTSKLAMVDCVESCAASCMWKCV